MKKKTIAIVLVSVLVGVALAALLGNLQQPTYTYTVNDGSNEFNEWEAQAFQEVFLGEDHGFIPVYSSTFSTESPRYGAIYTVTESYPIGRDTTYVFIPYLRGRVRDVGTAGSSDWTYEYGAVVMAWRGDKRIALEKIKFDADFTITADDNTSLDFEGPSLTIAAKGKQPFAAEESRAFFTESHHAATINSTLEENRSCNATLRWEGVCTVPRTLFRPAVGVQFTVEAQLPYVGNMK